MKNLLLVALCMVGTGLVMAVLSFFSGARTTVGFDNETGRLRALDSQQQEEHVQEQLPAFDNLVVDVRSAKVIIRQGDAYSVELRSYVSDLSDQKLTYSAQNGTLTVEELRSSRNGNFAFHIASFNMGDTRSNVATITLPGGASLDRVSIDCPYGELDLSGIDIDTLDVDCSYGKVTVDSVNTDTALLQLDNGKLSLRNFTADNLDCTNTYGSTKLDNGQLSHTFDSVSIVADNGQMELKGVQTGTLSIVNTYGDVTLENIAAGTLSADQDNGKFKATATHVGEEAWLENSYGSIQLKDWSSSALRVDMSNGQLELEGALEGVTDITNDYGSVELRLSRPVSDYSVDLFSNYGSVTVDGSNHDSRYYATGSGTNAITVECGSGDIRIRSR